VEVRSIRNSNHSRSFAERISPFAFCTFSLGAFRKGARYMRFESHNDFKTEFLSNALGIALVTASTWPIRADQARSSTDNRQQYRQLRTHNSKYILRWTYFWRPAYPLSRAICLQAKKSGHGRPFRQRLFLGSATLSWSTLLLRSSRREPGELGCGEQKGI